MQNKILNYNEAVYKAVNDNNNMHGIFSLLCGQVFHDIYISMVFLTSSPPRFRPCFGRHFQRHLPGPKTSKTIEPFLRFALSNIAIYFYTDFK